MMSRFGLKPSCLSQKSATVEVTRPNLLSIEPRPYTKPFSTTAVNGIALPVLALRRHDVHVRCDEDRLQRRVACRGSAP